MMIVEEPHADRVAFVLLSIWKRCRKLCDFSKLLFRLMLLSFRMRLWAIYWQMCFSTNGCTATKLIYYYVKRIHSLYSVCVCVSLCLVLVCSCSFVRLFIRLLFFLRHFEKYYSWYAWVCKCNALLLCQCHLFCYPFWRGLSCSSARWRWADEKKGHHKMRCARHICVNISYGQDDDASCETAFIVFRPPNPQFSYQNMKKISGFSLCQPKWIANVQSERRRTDNIKRNKNVCVCCAASE